MRLILSVSSNNEHYDADCHYAVLDLTPELISACLHRHELWKMCCSKDTSLYQLTFWDYSVQYISCPDEFPTLNGDEPERGGYAEIKQNYMFPEELYQRTECGVMLVDERDVSWRCIPKHSYIYVETIGLPWEFIGKVHRKEC